MKSLKSLALVVSGLVVFAAGCAQRPELELNAAQEAVKNAVSAEAGVYAPDELKAAEDLMSSAAAELSAQDEAFALSRDFDQAKKLLADAEAKGTAAAEAARANKEQVKLECEELKLAAEAAIATATEMLAKAPKGKGTKADIEALQGDLSGLGTALTAASASYDAGQYMTARDELRSVVTKAEAISAEIETAILKRGSR